MLGTEEDRKLAFRLAKIYVSLSAYVLYGKRNYAAKITTYSNIETYRMRIKRGYSAELHVKSTTMCPYLSMFYVVKNKPMFILYSISSYLPGQIFLHPHPYQTSLHRYGAIAAMPAGFRQ